MVKHLEGFNLNSARPYLGRHVNIHLKDGSVIVNVRVTMVKRDDYRKNASLHYATPERNTSRLPLKEVEWMELLNPFLLIGDRE